MGNWNTQKTLKALAILDEIVISEDLLEVAHLEPDC